MDMVGCLDDFKEEVECFFKGEKYSVRDNGAVFRHAHEGKKPRKYDNVWTFGNWNASSGCLEIASVRVHVIVATAFHGAKQGSEYVVEHIDKDKTNNRSDNLQWISRLEIALDNPFVRDRIVECCGSIADFLKDPSTLKEEYLSSNLMWLRTVRDAGSKVSKRRLQMWTESDENELDNNRELKIGKSQKLSKVRLLTENDFFEADESQQKNRSIGQDGFLSHNSRFLDIEIPGCGKIILSLTKGAAQEIVYFDEKPSEYPCTPIDYGENPLKTYAGNLSKNSVFWRHNDGKREYCVSKFGFSREEDSLFVMISSNYMWIQENGDSNPVPLANLKIEEIESKQINYQIVKVIYRENLFIHTRVTSGFLPRETVEEMFAGLVCRLK